MANPFSFYISQAMAEKLETLIGSGNRSAVVKQAVRNYKPESPEGFILGSPEKPWSVKVNVSRGEWMNGVEEEAKRLGTTVSAVVRYSLQRQIDALEKAAAG